MTFSLLIPCYNAEKYVDSFIKHLEEMNLHFDEVLFYDDASTDNTVDKLENLNQIVIKGKENRGPGFSRNRLAEAATSKYIHFHDIDDEFSPDFNDFIKQSIFRKCDVSLGNADWINYKTRIREILFSYTQIDINNDPLGYFIEKPLGVINTIYKKEAFLSVSGFDENNKCWEDADLHVRLAAKNSTFYAFEKIVAYSIRHNTGISKNQNYCWECRINFLRNYLVDYEKYSELIFNELRKALLASFHYKDKQSVLKVINLLKTNNQIILKTQNRILNLLFKLKLKPYYILKVRFFFVKVKMLFS